MVKREAETGDLQEQFAEARVRIEALEAAVADAEARGATARDEMAEVSAARDSAQGELEEARSSLRDAAVRYREAKLASLPELPRDLVSASESLDEIDAAFEAAQRVVSEVRERVQEERQAVRVPAGSPPRRAQDLSSLSATEKIRLGIEERDRR